MALLELVDISLRFGGIVALDGVSFSVHAGHITGLIGPNGAGKSTLFNCISRLYTPDSGAISFQGKNLLSASPHQVAGLGIARTFQNLELFKAMTVREHLLIGQHSRGKSDPVSIMLKLPFVRREEHAMEDRIDAMMEFLELSPYANQPVAALPFGIQKRVDFGRALIGRPKLLLLDEPAGGLNHRELETLSALIRRIRSEWNTTILLVEHNMGLVMSLCDRIGVLDFGRKIAEGAPAGVQSNPAVIEAYLGTPEAG